MENMSNYIKGRISKLANIFFSKRTYPKNGTQFIVSVYAAMPDANEKIIQKIKTYPGIVDLNSLYTSDEISFLVENFAYIFKEYHSFLKPFFGYRIRQKLQILSTKYHLTLFER